MAGEPGFEFVGPWEDRDAVIGAILDAGKKHGLVQVGGRAYLTNSLESGWLPRPLPAFYSGESTADFRKWLSASDIDANVSLGGSFYSENLDDYYLSPYDAGYGRVIKFDHDFIGREALEKQVETGRAGARRKVTLAWNGEDTEKAFGSMFHEGVGAKFINLPIAHYATYHYDRVESPAGDLRACRCTRVTRRTSAPCFRSRQSTKISRSRAPRSWSCGASPPHHRRSPLRITLRSRFGRR